MALAAVIDLQIAAQSAIAFNRSLEAHSIGPFAQMGLDKSFCLADGAGHVGPGAFWCQPQGLTGLQPQLGAVGAAVIREHPAASESLAAKPGHGSNQKADTGGLLSSGKTTT